MDLSCEVVGIKLKNPLILASGIMGTHASLLARAGLAGAGAVTTKSCGPVPRRGHVNPTVVDWGAGLINAVGLPNPGAEAEVQMLCAAKERLTALDVPLIASLFGGTVEEFAQVAETVVGAEPDLIEVNVSCPNVSSELGGDFPPTPFASSCDSAVAVTRAVAVAVAQAVKGSTSRVHREGTAKGGTAPPIAVKLAPNVPNIAEIARGVVSAGADAITAINTMPGMVIDIESGQPVLANKVGGVSGPALKPIAVRCVYEIAQAVDVPIIGTGGVNTGADAIEMIMAGATAVGVGSAVYYRGVEAFSEILDEMTAWLEEHGYESLDEIQGLAHREPAYGVAPSPAPIPSV
ncbi:MAG: Dihydroorotate dehydrogenase B (NAD(+)), catalytic subunit [Anaerolineales bacterium]|nr:Dihydroorotate dehydrogenase B (NAD(+)), catalytic subunit [Anaerolineales bacterium]